MSDKELAKLVPRSTPLREGLKKPRVEEKIRVLFLANYPFHTTGLSLVARKILDGLQATGKYHIAVVGINYDGDPHIWEGRRIIPPYAIFPANRAGEDTEDRLGRNRFLSFLENDVWDLVFMLYDPFILYPALTGVKKLQDRSKKRFKSVAYLAVDSTQDALWIQKGVSYVDYPVAYIQYGYDEIAKFADDDLKKKLRIINHGIDTKTFYPLPEERCKEIRHQLFPEHENDFILINIGRNQLRKDLPRTLMVYKELRKKYDKYHLYLHCDLDDVGGDLRYIARQLDLEPGVDFSSPSNFDASRGVPDEIMNCLYNAGDLLMSSSKGEGWGLPMTQAMAAKLPVVMPDNTTAPEILANGVRGTLVKSGSTSSEWESLGISDKNRIRPSVNVDDFVEKVEYIRTHPKETQEMAEKGYLWATTKTMSWESKQEEWGKLFDEAYKSLEEERTRIRTAGRNNDCPVCGKGKWKNCKQHKHLCG